MNPNVPGWLRGFRRASFPRPICGLALGLLLLAQNTGLAVGLEGGFRIISVTPRTKPAPQLWAQPAPQVSPLINSPIATPPLEGPIVQIAITITDQREAPDSYDFLADSYSGISGSLLAGSTTNVIFGLLDSGSGTHLVSYPDALDSGLQGDYLTENTLSASGVDGSVDMDVSEPVGFFAEGLQTLTPQGQPQPSLMFGQANFSALVNTPDNYSSGIDTPTLIGAPFLLFFPALIRNSQPIKSSVDGTPIASPSVTFYGDPSDPSIPVLTHKIFLEVRPLGQPVVGYILLLDEHPYEPSTIISGSGASALFFTASSVALSKSGSTSSGQMVVDTGSQASLISEIAAAELNLDLQNPDFEVQVQGLASAITAPGFYIDSMSVPAGGGAVIWTNVPVIVLDVASPEGGTLYGIIGSNLTATRDLVFNGAASTPYLGVTDPIVAPVMKITAFRRTGPNSAEFDWHTEPAPPVFHLQRCSSLGPIPPTWVSIATNSVSTTTGTLTISNLPAGNNWFRLQAAN